MKKRKVMMALVAATVLMLSLAGCSGKNSETSSKISDADKTSEAEADGWNLIGNFADEERNALFVNKASKEDGYEKDGWAVAVYLGEDFYDGILDEEAQTLKGQIMKYDDKGDEGDSMDVTLEVEYGEDSAHIILKTPDKEYDFEPYDTDEALSENK